MEGSDRERREGRSYHHRALRESILREARQMISEGGVAALNIRSLTRRLHVSPSALYHHFEGRSGVLRQIAISGFQELEAAFQLSRRDDKPIDAIGEMAHRYIQFAIQKPGVFRVMIDQYSVDDPALRKAIDAVNAARLEQAKACAAAINRDRSAEAIDQNARVAAHGTAMLLIDGQVPPHGRGVDVQGFVYEAVQMLKRSIKERRYNVRT